MRDNFYDCRYVYRDIVLCIMDLCYNGYNSKYYNDNCSIKINNKEEKDKQKISIEKRGIAIGRYINNFHYSNTNHGYWYYYNG